MKKITKLTWLCLLFFSSISLAQTARVQVIHNSPDLAASSVDVYLNGVLLLNDFHFRTATPFIDAPAGVELSIDIAPSTSTSSAESLYNLTTTLEEFETYIIVANGIVSPTGYSPNQPFALNVYVGGREGTAVENNTDVLVMHGSPDAPTVDVVELAVPAGTIVNDISYGSFSNYLELPTSNYVLAVRDETGAATVETYSAPLANLFLETDAVTVLASGFLDPSVNSDGPAFGLWVALASGGDLIPLPLFHNPTARLQVIHNSPDLAASTVDVYVNDELLLDNFAFRTATPFIDVPAGIALSIDVAPSTSTSSAESLYNLTATLEPSETYIIIANGIVSGSGYAPNQAFALNVLVGGREGTAVEDTTDVIVFHGSTDAPTVDVVETSVPAGTLVDNLSYGSFSDYLELPTNNYIIDVRDETGTVTVATYSAPLADLFLELDAITVLASGFLDPSANSDGPSFGLWVAKATGGDLIPLPLVETPTARLQAIHNSPDLAAALVDVYVNDELLLNDFAFRTATPFIDVPAGVDLSIDIAPSTSTSSAESLYNLTANLTEGETYILVANGIVSPTGYSVGPNFAINVYAQGREAASSPANTDVLVNHGSPDAPTVDVVETSLPAGTIVDNISFPEFQGYLELPNLDFTLDVRDATGTLTVASYQAPLQTLGLNGAAITVLASGFLDPSVNSNGPAFGLWVALASGGDLIPLPLVETPTARLQAIHNSPDLAAALVDVYVNDELLLNDFAFRTATPFIDVPAGVDLSIDIAPSTSTSSAESLYNLTANLTEGETYILVANGIVSPTGYSVGPNFAINVYAQGREAASSPANTDVLVNHGSPDAPTVDVVETSLPAGTIVDNISFPEFQGYLELPNLDFTLDVRDATGTLTVASYQAPLQTLGLNGAAITVLASGFLDPSVNSNGPAFGLWVALASGGDLIPLPQIPLSVNNFDLNSVSLYPNPARETITLSIPFDYENFKATIYDLSGRQVKTVSNPNNIDVSDLNSGMYIMNTTLNDLSFNQKFVKN
ncbi:DUF4397 domain-containing protein [uncultured Flavobacterium sp.]|uniref:DUF4397 domain-containing protein n=1 Tax=uncultured Flavobacterium sp. TaxID=165435 RepID=UPI002629C37B|nr:DUF4397 domain-containing protein [uncultured Flavobacterium sp.]